VARSIDRHVGRAGDVRSKAAPRQSLELRAACFARCVYRLSTKARRCINPSDLAPKLCEWEAMRRLSH
jgi:hypothetical protein